MANPIKALIAILLMGLIGASMPLAVAAEDNSFTIDVDFDDKVAPGTIVPVEITLENLDEKYDVEEISVKVTLYDGSERLFKEKIEIDHISQDHEEELVVNVPIPADVEEGTYDLKVEATGEWEDAGNDAIAVFEDKLEVEFEDDSLAIINVELNSNTFESGDALDVAVTVLNNGKEDAENVKVSVAIPELNVVKSVDVLNDIRDGDEYTSYLVVKIPEAKDGTYTLKVSAVDAYTSAVYEQKITIENAQVVEPVTNDNVVVPVTIPTQDIPNGKGSVFTLTVKNNEQAPKELTFSVAGTGDWATARVDPATITLDAGESASVHVYVMPKETGEHSFTVYTKEAGKTISATEINTNVVGTSASTMNSMFILLIFVVVAAFLYFKQRTNGKSKVATY